MKKDKFDPFKELLEKLKQNQIEIKTVEKDKQNQITDLKIKNAKVKEDETLVKSPLDGVVIDKNYNNGEYVTTGAQVLTVADLNDLFAAEKYSSRSRELRLTPWSIISALSASCVHLFDAGSAFFKALSRAPIT